MEQAELIKTAAYLLDKIEKKSSPANEIIADYVRTHRYLSSGDRHQILDLVWSAIRGMARLKYAYPTNEWEERLLSFTEKGLPDCSNAPDWVR